MSRKRPSHNHDDNQHQQHQQQKRKRERKNRKNGPETPVAPAVKQQQPVVQQKREKKPKFVKLYTYGSLNRGMIESLTGTRLVRPPVPAYLDNHIRIFADYSDYWSGAVASVYPNPGTRVYGALVYLTPDQFEALDVYEGGYTRVKRMVTVLHTDKDGRTHGKKKMANIYIKDETEYLAPPSRRYLNSIRTTLRDVGLLDKDTIDVNAIVDVGKDKHALAHIYKAVN